MMYNVSGYRDLRISKLTEQDSRIMKNTIYTKKRVYNGIDYIRY